MDVFLDEDETSLAIFTLRQPISLGLIQEVSYVIICEVTEDPLDPDSVVFRFINVLLEAFVIEISHSWNIVPSLIDLND